MSTEYQLRIYNRAGALQAVVVDFLSLAYRHQRNAPGILEFDIAPNHAAVTALELDGEVEVWRRVPGGDWYADFYGLYRWQQQGLDNNGRQWLKVRCPGLLHLLQRAIVAYTKGVAGRSAFTATPAETIIKAMVLYNCTDAGTTTDGRLRDVTLAGVQLESDAARGASLDFECSLQNVLSSAQKAANASGADFTMTKAAAATWQFEWVATNTTDVVFAPNFGNMARPVLTSDWMNTPTVAIAGANNAYAVVEGDRYIAEYQDAEIYTNAPNYTTEAGLTAAGEAALAAVRATELTFDVLQVPQSLYGVHYGFLDWVTARFAGTELAMQIQEVGVSIGQDGKEQIQVICRE